MRRIYIDGNVLIAYFSTDKAEESKKKMVENALGVFAQLKDTQLCTSMWAVTEMVNILISAKELTVLRLRKWRASWLARGAYKR